MTENVFDYVKAINKKNIEITDFSNYVPFIVNRAFSYFKDTILFANELNNYPEIPKKLQFDYYINSLSKANRFSKWVKEENKEDLIIICEYYGFSMNKAKEALRILNKEQIEKIRETIKRNKNE